MPDIIFITFKVLTNTFSEYFFSAKEQRVLILNTYVCSDLQLNTVLLEHTKFF
jgi:hypothetical protein